MDASSNALKEIKNIASTSPMLISTFRHFRGISAAKEKALWRAGIVTWDDLDAHAHRQQVLPLFREDEDTGAIPLHVSRAALERKDASFFAGALDRREHFRIALSFPEQTLFLDIETTGLSRYYDSITLVGWSQGQKYGVYVRGGDDSRLVKALANAKVIVTFNGTLFDIPFLRQELPHLPIPAAHVDLRFLARRAGLSGGQKAIEDLLGLKRPANLQEIDGRAAPLLWHRYRRGDLDALRLLIEYNHADLTGMKTILDHSAKEILGREGVPRPILKTVPRFALPSRLSWSHGSRRANAIHIAPYRGETGPKATYGRLLSGLKGRKPTIVGIDLTGSAARPTGWCLLQTKKATTRLLGTNDEIVAETIAARPNVVSIDSPLSLPEGRTSVEDTDPGRAEYGIMRYCERVLKRRGVNVYPALIPSMQRLTARGIWLAKVLREHGVPVIESYPGAAQDILNIPRKRASLELLREGLAEFGLTGKFLRDPVTHDELDAVTSALVGVFFWAGKFEALGESVEEALFIPDLHVDARVWRHRIVVGFSGHVASGKTTAASFLADLGFHYARYSAVLRDLLGQAESEVPREVLQEFGDNVHVSKGQRWLNRELLNRLPKEGNLVIDGLRFPEDHAFLVEAFGPGFMHVHLDAPAETRHRRYLERGENSQAFEVSETHPVEQQVRKLRQLGHIVMNSDVSRTDFAASVLQLAVR